VDTIVPIGKKKPNKNQALGEEKPRSRSAYNKPNVYPLIAS